MGLSLNPLHDIGEVAHDVKNDVLDPVAGAVSTAADSVGLGAKDWEAAGHAVTGTVASGLNALNVPSNAVEHAYRTAHDVWTRYGVAAFANDMTWRLAAGVFDKNLDPQLNHSWELTGSGGTGLGSIATTNANYRDVYGNAVNPGFDFANFVDDVVNGHDYTPAGWTRNAQGVMEPTAGGGVDLPTGIVNALFRVGTDPTLVAGKALEAAKATGVALGAKKIVLAADATERAAQLGRLDKSGVPYNITADEQHAIVGGHVLIAPRQVRLLAAPDGSGGVIRATNIPGLVQSNPAIRDAFTRISAMKSPEEIFQSYPRLINLGRVGLSDLAKADTVEETTKVFTEAATVGNYGFLQHGLPTTGLTRRIAQAANVDLPTMAKVANNMADSNSLLRAATSYRPNIIDSTTKNLSSKEFNPDGADFPVAFRDALLAAGHTRKVANAIMGSYIDTPDLGSRINMITHMMQDALREAGVSDDHEIMLPFTTDADFLTRNATRSEYGVGRDGRSITVPDPADGSPTNFGIYNWQVGKIAFPDFNQVRKAVADSKGNLSPTGLLTRGDNWLYQHYTSQIFKNLVLLSLGMPIRIVAGEAIPAILQHSAREYAGSGLMRAAAKANPTLRDLANEYGPDALVGKAARVETTDVAGDLVSRTGKVVAVDHDSQALTVNHRDPVTGKRTDTVHPYHTVTMLHREISDVHIMTMAQNLGINVTKKELGHIRSAVGFALYGVGRALVDPDYYDQALRNTLTFGNHAIAPGIASNHDTIHTLGGAVAETESAMKQAGMRLPKDKRRFGDDFQLWDSGNDAHPIFWQHAIHGATRDSGAVKGAAAYQDALKAGASEEGARKAFIDADSDWLTNDPSQEAQETRTSMAHYGRGAQVFSRARMQSMEGLAYGQNDILNKDVLAALAGRREVPAIADLATRDLKMRPLAVAGRTLDPVVMPKGLEAFSQAMWRPMHSIINSMSRSPIYTMLSTEEYKTFKPLIEAGLVRPEEASDLAQVRAAKRMLPLIHNTKLRSQFSDLSQNVFPFWFAQEQAYKRYGRAIAGSPLAFRKAMIGVHGLNTSGVLRQDQSGNGAIVFPGGSLLGKTIQSAASGLGYNTMTGIPSVLSGNTISLKSVIPEGVLQPGAGIPSVSPLVAISLEEIQHRFPATEPWVSKVVGPINEDESMLDQLIPNVTAKRVYQALEPADRSKAGITAYTNVMAYFFHRSDDLKQQAAAALADGNAALAAKLTTQANSYFPAADADPAARQAVLDRMKNATRILLLTKAAVGFISPLSPNLDIGDVGLRKEFQDDLTTYGVAQGFQHFIDKHPNASADTVSTSDNSATGVSLPATQAAANWITANQKWIGSHDLAAAYLLPQTSQAFSIEAYNQEIAMGMRQKRIPGSGNVESNSFVEALYTAATDQLYYPSLDAYEKARIQYANNPTVLSQITSQWETYRAQLAAANPVWAASHASAQKYRNAQIAYDQLKTALTDPNTPESPQLPYAKELVDSYTNYTNEYAAIKAGLVYGTTETDLKDQFNNYLDQYVQSAPNASPLVTGIFRRLVDSG